MIDGLDADLTITADTTGTRVLIRVNGREYTWDPEEAIEIATSILDAAAIPFGTAVNIIIGMDQIEATIHGARTFGAHTARVASRILDSIEQPRT